MSVDLRSREEILGDLIRSILANTDLTDVAPGSTLSTLLEAIAASQYQISLNALKILENSNLESLVGSALDKKAESLRLPNGIGGIGRRPASSAGGVVTIGSDFSKKSTKFYAGKPAPFAGVTRLHLENASDMPLSGSIYIGRGTVDRYEGPIQYTSLTNNGSFWTMELASPLTKNHLHSDLVVLSQGGDRIIPAGTIVQTVSSEESPSVQYVVTSSAVLADGESEIDVNVVCMQSGEIGNALAGAIKEFASPPFVGATVTNKTAFVNGQSTESDEDLRKRIKNYPATLSRGTKSAILSSISGISDPETGKTLTSAVVIEPAESGDYSKVYIDDGSGLEPTFGAQAYELLLQSASGQETIFRTAQFPITPATLIGTENGPFTLIPGMSITIIIDGFAETYTITPSNYTNLSSATAYEIVRDFNNQSNIVGFRTYDGGKRIVIMDLSGKAEEMYVLPGNLQKILGIPVTKVRPIFLYQDSELKSFRGKTAMIRTRPYPWNLVASDLENVVVKVDGVTQIITISLSDFAEFGVTSLAGATLSQWATVLGRKIAGVRIDIAGNILVMSTRRVFSPEGTVEVAEKRDDGSWCGWVGSSAMWEPISSGGILFDRGSSKDYSFNRFTGELRFSIKPTPGTKIEVGTRNTRAVVYSAETPTGLFNLSPFVDSVGNARMVIGFDGDFNVRDVGIASGDNITPFFVDPVGAVRVIKLVANSPMIFRNAVVGDYMWLVKNLQIASHWGNNIESIYRLKRVGNNVSAVNKNYYNVTAKTTAGSDVITVTMPSHGFKSGSEISVVTSGSIGGIPAPYLSPQNPYITVIDNNNFTYVAQQSATSTAIGSLDVLIYYADCWVEFEVSDVQAAAWAAFSAVPQNILPGMIHIFSADGSIPQIVNFGNISIATVDDIVDIINSQISAGRAERVGGKKIAIRSNNWLDGTVAILGIVGNASNVFSVSSSVTKQSHTAFSTSGFVQSGPPIVQNVVNQSIGAPTHAYLHIDKSFVDIITTGNNPTIITPMANYPDGFEISWITGRQCGLEGRVYHNQTTPPYTGIMRTSNVIRPLDTSSTTQTSSNTYDLYSNYSIKMNDLHISPIDRLVVEMDLDPTNKTISIPLSKKAIIQDIDAITGVGKGQVISFQLADPDDIAKELDISDPYYNLPRPFFHHTSVYKNFDFRDFKILTKSVGLYREATTYNMAAWGKLALLPVDPVSGINDGDTITISDGNVTKVFEFSEDGIVGPGNIAVTYTPGARATGSLTAIGIQPGVLLNEGDTFIISDGYNSVSVFEFDSDNSLSNPANIPVTYIPAQKASGTLTSFPAGPTNGITDGDTFTISDGISSYVYEFDFPARGTLTAVAADPSTGIVVGDTFTISDGVTTNIFEFTITGVVTPGNIPVILNTPTDNALLVKGAIILAINGAGFNVTAIPGVGNLINLINSGWGVAGNVPITESFTNTGVTLSPTGMSGAGVASGNVAVPILPTYSSGQVKTAIIGAINGSGIQILASAGVGDLINLLNNNFGTAGNVPITESFTNTGVTLYPNGMSGGVNYASAADIKNAIISAINGVTLLNVTASSGSGNIILLTNDNYTEAGNVPITESIASGASLSPVGMSGGISNPSAATMRGLLRDAINGVVNFGVKASNVGNNGIILTNNLIGTIGNVAITQSIASGGSIVVFGMSGGLLYSANSDRAIAVRSTSFGSPMRLRISLRLPTKPDISNIVVSHVNDYKNGVARCNLIVTLPSGSMFPGSLINNGLVTINVIPSGNLYMLIISENNINSGGQYQPGRILNIDGNSPLSGSYYIINSSIHDIIALAPGHGGMLGISTLNASSNPISCFPLEPKTWSDIANAINEYLPSNPIATAQVYGSNIPTNPVTLPTYISHSISPAYTGDIMSQALIYHSIECKLSGSAGIWQYDSSVIGVNNIKATCQSVDSIFPTISEANGTAYTPVGEEVMIVPTNSKTLSDWINFNATSSYNIVGDAERVNSGRYIQLSSKSDGSLGGIKVTGVTGNKLESFVIGNGTNEEFSTKINILSTDAQSLMRGFLVRIQNSVSSELYRPYRIAPEGNEITTYNTTSISTFFRPTTSIKYVKLGANLARLIFYRYGQYPGQSEPLSASDNITLTSLGNGKVKVTSSGGDLAARVGDMMYIRPESNFPSDVKCKGLPSSGITDSSEPEYWGYPVIKVIDEKNIVVVAPNIVSFGTTSISSPVDLVFISAIYNEKNIKTNKNWGAKFETAVNNNQMTYLIKHLGGGVMSLWVQNSATEATDSMGLSEVLVNTDDYITIGEGFNASNRGSFKIIGTNGRNHVIYYNPIGGQDEIIDSKFLSGGGAGRRKWGVGPITGSSRPIRIIDAESVRIGDRLRISAPSSSSTWFPASMYGSWNVVGIGYIGISPATGTLTAVAAHPTTGIKDGDKFMIGDGQKTYTFEFDTNGSVTTGNIRVIINSNDSAGAVKTAIMNAINELGANFGISAISGTGNVINLINRRIFTTPSVPITEVFDNPGVTLSPVGMSAIAADNGQICSYIDIELPNAVNEIFDENTGYPIDKLLILGNDSAIGFVEKEPFYGYRMIAGYCVSQINPELCDLYLAPRLQTHKMTENFGTKIIALGKIGFEERAFQGIDGYKVFSGLVRQAHRVIDGLPENTISYPGNKAMGTSVEVLPPLIRAISMSLQVVPKDGVTLNSISEVVKSSVASYINGLGVGKPVIISEIIRLVQGLPGVYSVSVVSATPAIIDDRIGVLDIEKARVFNAATDIIVG